LNIVVQRIKVDQSRFIYIVVIHYRFTQWFLTIEYEH